MLHFKANLAAECKKVAGRSWAKRHNGQVVVRHRLNLHAFISSHLDSCNSLFTCLNQKSVDHLQTVQNSAATILATAKRRPHHSSFCPVTGSRYVQFYWLLWRFTVTFFPATLLAPYKPGCTLRFLGSGLLTVPDARLKTKGDKAVRAPRFWNDLPEWIRAAESVNSLKYLLKTYFYRRAFPNLLEY